MEQKNKTKQDPKSSGTVRLEIGGKTIAKRRYCRRDHRKQIVAEWMQFYEKYVHTRYVVLVVCPD